MQLQSCAKINLHLRVAPPGADGFHPIMSWFATVGLRDEMEFEATSEPGIVLTCNDPHLKTDRANLIVRAGEALMTAAGQPRLGARIHLAKKIPPGGGLGGGSSNAAFTMIGLNQLWKLNFDIPRLAQIGAKLGSDVPFFFHGPSSICTGRGEHVVPIHRPRPKFVLLIFPPIAMPTPQVYRKFDVMKLGSNDAIQKQPDWANWTELKSEELLPLLVNDLEPPAFAIRPELGELREKTEQILGRIVRMSGSGSTLFTLLDDESQHQVAIDKLKSTSISATAFELAR
jgi:4-diphosphocytidyl-2-C-methyl-D-erythritol kinase